MDRFAIVTGDIAASDARPSSTPPTAPFRGGSGVDGAFFAADFIQPDPANSFAHKSWRLPLHQMDIAMQYRKEQIYERE